MLSLFSQKYFHCEEQNMFDIKLLHSKEERNWLYIFMSVECEN